MDMNLLRKRMKEAAAAEPEKPRKRRRKAPSAPLAIVHHRVFIPALTAWGAALGGLSIIILPGATIASLAMATGLAGLGDFARVVMALMAACVLGAAAFFGARALRTALLQRREDNIVSAMNGRMVQPLDPASELGSESFDAPLAPELTREEVLGEDPAHTDYGEAFDAPVEEDLEAHEPLELASDHEVLELEEALSHEPGFDEEPAEQPAVASVSEEAGAGKRDEVWVVGSADEVDGPARTVRSSNKSDKSPEAQNASDATSPSAIEQLRQAPINDLSLVQLVERFAAALHDHQDKSRSQASFASGTDPSSEDGGTQPSPLQQPRDAALTEALKALSKLTESVGPTDASSELDQDQPRANVGETERVLRDALTRLQEMRGAA